MERLIKMVNFEVSHCMRIIGMFTESSCTVYIMQDEIVHVTKKKIAAERVVGENDEDAGGTSNSVVFPLLLPNNMASLPVISMKKIGIKNTFGNVVTIFTTKTTSFEPYACEMGRQEHQKPTVAATQRQRTGSVSVADRIPTAY